MKNVSRKEIVVKCSLCGDMWHTTQQLGEQEGCTYCDDVFYIQPEDIATSDIGGGDHDNAEAR